MKTKKRKKEIMLDGVPCRRIKGWENYYVSAEGDIISFVKGDPIVMATWGNQYGHQYCRLKENGKKKTISVHRTVAEAFINNPEHHSVVRHLNDIPDDNRVENLAWGTYKDNTDDCRRRGRMYVRPVYCFENDQLYSSCVEAAEDFEVSKSSVTQACKNGSTIRGCHFCYEEDIEKKRSDKFWLNGSHGYKPLIAIDPDGNRFFFKSRREASDFIGIPLCGISSVINGRLEHTHGWRFKEAKEYGEVD